MVGANWKTHQVELVTLKPKRGERTIPIMAMDQSKMGGLGLPPDSG